MGLPKFSAVVPIHNEERFLPYTFPSILRLHPDEVVCILDRCTDGSEEAILKIWDRYDWEADLRLIHLDGGEGDGWRVRVGYTRRVGFLKATYDTILTADADIIVDPAVAGKLRLLKWNVGLIAFGFLDYPPTVQMFLRRLYSRWLPEKGYTSLCAVSRSKWLECEDQMEARKAPAEDVSLHDSIGGRYRVLHFNTRSLHLRPTEGRLHDMRRGRVHAEIGTHPFKALAISIAMLRPHLFASYFSIGMARRKASRKKRRR